MILDILIGIYNDYTTLFTYYYEIMFLYLSAVRVMYHTSIFFSC